MDCAIPTAETEPAVLFPSILALGAVSCGFIVILIRRHGLLTLLRPDQTLPLNHPYMRYAALPCILLAFYVYLGSLWADDLAPHACDLVAEPTLYPTAFLLSWLSFGGGIALLCFWKRLAGRAGFRAWLALSTITICGTALSFDLAALGAPLLFQVWVPVAWGLISTYLTRDKPPQPPSSVDAQ